MPAHCFTLLRRCFVVLIAFAGLPVAATEVAQPSQAPAQAVWKQQSVRFHFQSFTTFYSCSSLEEKMKRILVALGANEATSVRSRGCTVRDEISRMPSLEIELISPVEATPAALAELNKTKSTRELAARVRGDSAKADKMAAQFPAQWRRVSFSRGQLRLEPGDCELIEQVKRRVLPKLAVKIVTDEVRCLSHQLSSAQPRLVVDVLVEMPTPDAATTPEARAE